MSQVRARFKGLKIMGIEDKYTWVDTDGQIIRQGNGGVVVVPHGTMIPALQISEVSDDEVINLFVNHPTEAGVMKSEGFENCWEVLLNRPNG
jgi:hypothetical protein